MNIAILVRTVPAMGAIVLGGCAIIPRTTAPAPPAPPPVTQSAPSPISALPDDVGRHRVALLVPLAGEDAGIGQAMANASTMAILDTGADNLRVTTYDTSGGVAEAARSALADGNALILGPLNGGDVAGVRAVAAPAGVPVVSFSGDSGVAGGGVFTIGLAPEQAAARGVSQARDTGARSFAILAADTAYGQRVEAAFLSAISEVGARHAGTERYVLSNTSVVSAAARLAGINPDAVLIADAGPGAVRAAQALRAAGSQARIVGTERWSGEGELLRTPALEGATYAALSDARFAGFVASYRARFGDTPYRAATLGYDAVLMALRLAQNWQPGTPLPMQAFTKPGGFEGIDGTYRFERDGMAVRALEVRELGDGTVRIADPARLPD